MLEVRDLGLTLFQMNEVENADPALVDAWLEAAAAPEIRSPTGFFLKGLRTGSPPQGTSNERVHIVQAAEHWMARVGALYDREESALAELFDRGGMLQHFVDDPSLVERMRLIWVSERPRAERMEREVIERAERNKATYFALREVKNEPGASEDAGGTGA